MSCYGPPSSPLENIRKLEDFEWFFVGGGGIEKDQSREMS